jgi:hypothetical protein
MRTAVGDEDGRWSLTNMKEPTAQSRLQSSDSGTYSRRIAHYAMRMVLGGAGLFYFYLAGSVTGLLPLQLTTVLALIGAYVVANASLMLRRQTLSLHAVDLLTVFLDLGMLVITVLEDPSPASPVTILLLSTVFDYGQRLTRTIFSSATALALVLLPFNAWARASVAHIGFPLEGISLSMAIGVLIVNFYVMTRASYKMHAERRRMAMEIDALQRRDGIEIERQLRMARIGDSLRLTGLRRSEFADHTLRCLVREFGATAAALYVQTADCDGVTLSPLATYAADLPRLGHQKIALDEGLIGACAREQRSIEIHQVPEGYFDVAHGLGQINPQHLYILPLSFHSQLAGVVEFAMLQPLSEVDKGLLEQAAGTLAASLLVAERMEPLHKSGI